MKQSEMKDSSDSSTTPSSQKRIALTSLKLLIEKFPPGSPLRDLILSEADSLNPQEFLAKADIWLKLLRRDKIRD